MRARSIIPPKRPPSIGLPKVIHSKLDFSLGVKLGGFDGSPEGNGSWEPEAIADEKATDSRETVVVAVEVANGSPVDVANPLVVVGAEESSVSAEVIEV